VISSTPRSWSIPAQDNLMVQQVLDIAEQGDSLSPALEWT
jgi:hypothetical protein